MKKKVYTAPRVLKTLPVEMEHDLLSGSVVTKDTRVKTTGQEVVSYDFSQPSFNQEWE